MFATIARSWDYAKASYGVLWNNRSLLVLPVVSGAAGIVVTLSFLLPMWGFGTLEQWQAVVDGEGEASPVMYAVLFAFYFCNYFVIVFFNAALIACTMDHLAGRPVSVSRGLAAATRRLPEILLWSLVSAVVGVILRAIENSNKRGGQIVSAILGVAWTVLTYFVVPVIVVEGAGPVEAFKRSSKTLKGTWGTALAGNFSLGLLAFLVMLPVIAVAVLLAVVAGPWSLIVTIPLVVIGISATSAADVIFKGVLYAHATGRDLPADMQALDLDGAFESR